MPNDIKCPNCGNVFDVEDVLAADIEKKIPAKIPGRITAIIVQNGRGKEKTGGRSAIF